MKTSRSTSHRQSKRRARVKRRTIFISAPLRVNLDTIKSLLKERGVRPLVSSELLSTGAFRVERITKAISETDLVIGILHPKETNANVFFELGLAAARGKRLLILASPELESLPFDIMGMLHIRADVENREAINFALDQALAAPEPRRQKPSQPVGRGRPIGQLADTLIERLESLGEQVIERDVEHIVVSALRASGISVVVHSQQPDFGVDLAIWDDELDPWVGNPLLIEITRNLADRAHVAALLDLVFTYVEKSHSRWALVLYIEGPPPTFDFLPSVLSTVLFLRVRELLDRLRGSSFGEIIRDLRNRRVHKRGL